MDSDYGNDSSWVEEQIDTRNRFDTSLLSKIAEVREINSENSDAAIHIANICADQLDKCRVERKEWTTRKWKQEDDAKITGSKRRFIDGYRCYEDGTRKKGRIHEELKGKCLFCGSTGMLEDAHIFAVGWATSRNLSDEDVFKVGSLLEDWRGNGRWQRVWALDSPMNFIPLCEEHHLSFDTHNFTLNYDVSSKKVLFYSFLPGYEKKVKMANKKIPGNLNVLLSKRSIAYRLSEACSYHNKDITEENFLMHQRDSLINASVVDEALGTRPQRRCTQRKLVS